ncbi:MAG: YkgJ family cysteine cluster protein [Bacteroidales bacterium]|nr:YkgJ family cysteine cluster protein [Bacteroidales bacterium]
MQSPEAINKYLALREELDAHCERLYKFHALHLNCREGCDQCCMDFGIFPVEYLAIKEQAGSDLGKGQKPDSETACPFLVDHRCVIYHARPMICRTQGLPLLFMGEDGWELSACELNFTAFDFEKFTSKNTFPQDKYNSRLYLINKEFIESLPGKPYQPLELIPMRRLFQGEERID